MGDHRPRKGFFAGDLHPFASMRSLAILAKLIMVNMHEAKTRLSELVKALEMKNEPIILCRNGEPVAQIVPFRKKVDRLNADPSLLVKIKYDPTEPLSEDEIPPEYR